MELNMASQTGDIIFLDWMKKHNIFLVIYAIWLLFIIFSTYSMVNDPEYSGRSIFVIFGGLLWILLPILFMRFRWRQYKSDENLPPL